MLDLHRELIEGHVDVPRVGSVVHLAGRFPPFGIIGRDGDLVGSVDAYLRDLALNDNSPSTGKSYANDLLRWFRLLWVLDTPWEKATEAEAAALVGWLRTAPNPQRRRRQLDAPRPGSVNLRTGKKYLTAGYAPSTINHTLTAVHGFYAYHGHYGRGPVANPVPESAARRRALAHHSPLEPFRGHKRARLRQRVTKAPPRAISDALMDELYAAMNSDRDRALIELYVSSGARASELLGVELGDIDWSGHRIFVVSKGSREREPVPASPEGFLLLAAYLDQVGLPGQGQPVFRTIHGAEKPLTYWAMRRVVQRANVRLGTNWTLHDLRHTAATRMANDPSMSVVEVQTILRHANLATTSRYVGASVEEIFDKLQEHFARPKVVRSFAPGYDAADVTAVFGG